MKTGLLIGGGLFWFIAAWSGGVPGAAAGLLFLLQGKYVLIAGVDMQGDPKWRPTRG